MSKEICRNVLKLQTNKWLNLRLLVFDYLENSWSPSRVCQECFPRYLDSNIGEGAILIGRSQKGLTGVSLGIRMQKKSQDHGGRKNGIEEQVVTRSRCG